MEIYNSRKYNLEFTDVVSFLEEFNDKIIELEEKCDSLEKYNFNLEEKVNDNGYEIERLQKILDENGITY